MTVWEYLDRVGQRRAKVALERPVNVRLLANVIGCALISGFLGALFALFAVPIPPENEQIVTYMIGQLSGFAGGIVAYHYTLTAGAKEMEAKRADNTKAAFEAITETAKAAASSPGTGAAQAATEVADAAADKADEIKGDVK